MTSFPLICIHLLSRYPPACFFDSRHFASTLFFTPLFFPSLFFWCLYTIGKMIRQSFHDAHPAFRLGVSCSFFFFFWLRLRYGYGHRHGFLQTRTGVLFFLFHSLAFLSVICLSSSWGSRSITPKFEFSELHFGADVYGQDAMITGSSRDMYFMYHLDTNLFSPRAFLLNNWVL